MIRTYNNTIFIGRPNQSDANQACSGCGGLNPTDPTYINQLSSRKKRDIVKEQIKDYVLLSLGAPVLDIELDEQQIDLAVNLALEVFEEFAPREYFQHYVFNTTPGQSVYELPPDIGFVRSVNYNKTPLYTFNAADLGGVIPLEYMGSGAYGSIAGGINPQQPIWGKAGEWALFKSYESLYSRMSSQEGSWEWLGDYRTIKIYPIPMRAHGIIVHYLQKNKDWSQVTQGMREGALIFAKEMLGRIRSKIQNPVGPGGGLQLDGLQLLQEAREDKKEWEQRLINRYGDLLPITWG
jgi:hypothetical protein